jgi:hypothetical protein
MTDSRRKRSLLDYWLWEPPLLKAFVIVAAVIPMAACCILLPFFGAKSLFVLLFLLFAPGIGAIYRAVGKRVDRLRDATPPDVGPAVPGLIVRGMVQSPGMVVQGQESLILHPIVGERTETKLSEIESVREVTWFNGTQLVGKTGFWFKVPGRDRLACAVPNSYTSSFKAWLSAGMNSNH